MASVNFRGHKGSEQHAHLRHRRRHVTAVATIVIKPFERTQAEGSKQPGFVDVHTAIAETLERLRWDDEVRIIVITGAEDGEFYWAPGPVLRPPQLT